MTQGGIAFARRSNRDSDFTDPRLAPYAAQLRYLDTIGEAVTAAIDSFGASARRDEAEVRTGPSQQTKRFLEEARRLQEAHSAGIEDLINATGLPRELFDVLEEQELPPREFRYSRSDVLDVRPTGDVTEYAEKGLEALRGQVDPRWLADQARLPYRLGHEFISAPLHLVAGIRVAPAVAKPQRFAQMLLVTDDHLKKRDGLDFLEAPLLVAEVAALGTRLHELKQLGPEAISKLRRLPEMTNEEVGATVYELLVGTAAVRMNVDLEMLPADKSRKTPDYRIHNLATPASIECKRRLGLFTYEMFEAEHIRSLYELIRPALAERHASVEVHFTEEVSSVKPAEFAGTVNSLLSTGGDVATTPTPWGTLSVLRLPYTIDLPRTRLYAPDFLACVFGWDPDTGAWDGLSCEVDEPNSILVQRARNPRCLKWVSRSAKAMLKKSRGITSLWGQATQQIGTGDMGFVYIAYTEGNRDELADARTKEIQTAPERWFHRWSIRVGATMVNRLYPRALGCGMPDLIESTIPVVAPGDDYFLAMLPSLVFVPPQARA